MNMESEGCWHMDELWLCGDVIYRPVFRWRGCGERARPRNGWSRRMALEVSSFGRRETSAWLLCGGTSVLQGLRRGVFQSSRKE